jgi:hypothetical protein
LVADRTGLDFSTFSEVDATLWKAKGWGIWEDGSVINFRLNGQPMSKITSFAKPSTLAWSDIVNFKERVFVGRQVTNDEDPEIAELQVDASNTTISSQGRMVRTIKSAPIPVNSRTNISLVNPVFMTQGGTQGEGAAGKRSIIYATRVIYDFSASATYMTATASGDSTGLWQSGAGTGRAAQIEVDLISMALSASSELLLIGYDLTLGETGGL